MLGELRRVVARAQALEDRPPRADLWPGVAAAIGATPPRRHRILVSVPQLLAAGIALVLLSGGAVAAVMRFGAWSVRPDTVAVATPPAPEVLQASGRGTRRGYDAAIRQLEEELTLRRDKLDTLTARVVEDKLRLVDRAIRDAERALAADPGNAYLTSHLTQTRLTKLELLRRATALTRAVS
jgi:hypothetical protein